VDQPTCVDGSVNTEGYPNIPHDAQSGGGAA
jgi:hypothetical protein